MIQITRSNYLPGPILPRSVLLNPDLKPSDKLVFAYLLDLQHFFDAVFPSQGKIAEEVGLSLASVERSVKRLKSRGNLVVSRKSRNGTNTYEIYLHEGLQVAPNPQNEGSAPLKMRDKPTTDSTTPKPPAAEPQAEPPSVASRARERLDTVTPSWRMAIGHLKKAWEDVSPGYKWNGAATKNLKLLWEDVRGEPDPLQVVRDLFQLAAKHKESNMFWREKWSCHFVCSQRDKLLQELKERPREGGADDERRIAVEGLIREIRWISGGNPLAALRGAGVPENAEPILYRALTRELRANPTKYQRVAQEQKDLGAAIKIAWAGVTAAYALGTLTGTLIDPETEVF